MQEVVLDRNVRLLDCPGVVFDDQGAVLGNCIDVDTLEDPIQHVEALLKRCDHQSLMITYKIPRFPENDVMIFLALVAKSYGRVRKGGIPDKDGAAKAVLKDWNAGKIPYFTAPPDSEPDEGTEATVVTELAKEFDFTKFDDVVMEALDDEKDEVDFITLREGPTGVLEAMDEDKSDSDEDGTDEEDGNADETDDDVDETMAENKAVARAENYDFNTMM
jgi:nuclear GTP-binding protein